MGHTEESKQKMRLKALGRKHTEETKQRLREHFKGKHTSPDTEFKKGGISPRLKPNGHTYIGKHDGYRYITFQGSVKKYCRYIWEKHQGQIPKNWIIHHKDGDKLNDDIENLQCVSRSEHHRIHGKERGGLNGSVSIISR